MAVQEMKNSEPANTAHQVLTTMTIRNPKAAASVKIIRALRWPNLSLSQPPGNEYSAERMLSNPLRDPIITAPAPSAPRYSGINLSAIFSPSPTKTTITSMLTNARLKIVPEDFSIS